MKNDIDQITTEVARHLSTTLAGKVAAPEVLATVRAAEQDLRGQVTPGALHEMLHQLAAYRLTHQPGRVRASTPSASARANTHRPRRNTPTTSAT